MRCRSAERQVGIYGLFVVVLALTALVASILAPSAADAAVADQFNWPLDGQSYANDVAWHVREEGQKAVDVSAGPGVPVYAAATGVVEYAGPHNASGTCTVGGRSYPAGYGNLVTIRHTGPATYYTLYGHLTAWTVTSGQTVSRGQQIGTVGSTGCSTGPHVHFQIGTCKAASVSAIVTPAHCSIWNGPDTTAGSVSRSQLIPGSYPGLEGAADADGDGIPDPQDRCPTQPGPASTGGCPDRDGDGIADTDDLCPATRDPSGTTAWRGCPSEVYEPPNMSDADANGDGKADYCRAVGGGAAGQKVQCTLNTGSGFGATYTSAVLDWGYDTGRAWVDANGDGMADYCRRVGDAPANRRIQCTLNTGSGFGATYTSAVLDWGYEPGRAWVDANGDGRADYCRVVEASGSRRAQCTPNTGSGFGTTYSSGTLDPGYETGRAWVDANGDGMADYCRRVGDAPANRRIQCTLNTGSGFSATYTSAVLDWGYETGRAWVDANGDGKADYCRVVGDAPTRRVQCTPNTGSGFGATYSSGALDWGYEVGRAWVDANGDGKADYCRRVGDSINQKVQCTLSTGSGFGVTYTSAALDWGYETGRAWTDANGDGTADYCRVVGSAPNRRVQCTLNTGSSFGSTFTSASLDWGYEPGRAWVGFGSASRCRTADPRPRCVSAPPATSHAVPTSGSSAAQADRRAPVCSVRLASSRIGGTVGARKKKPGKVVVVVRCNEAARVRITSSVRTVRKVSVIQKGRRRTVQRIRRAALPARAVAVRAAKTTVVRIDVTPAMAKRLSRLHRTGKSRWFARITFTDVKGNRSMRTVNVPISLVR